MAHRCVALRAARAAAALSPLLVSDCCVRQPVPNCDPAQQGRRQRRWHVPRIAVPVSAAYCALHPCSLPLAPAGSDWVGGFSHPPPLLFEPGSDSNPAARPRARDISPGLSLACNPPHTCRSRAANAFLHRLLAVAAASSAAFATAATVATVATMIGHRLTTACRSA